MFRITTRLASGAMATQFLPGREDGPDEASAARAGRFHMPAIRAVACFRLVAELVNGQRKMLCMGDSPGAVRAHARANRDIIPAHTCTLIVERWTGTRSSGHWVEMR